MNDKELEGIELIAWTSERVDSHHVRALIAEVRKLEKEYTEVLSDARKADLAMLEAKAEVVLLRAEVDSYCALAGYARRYGGYE